MDEFFNLLKTVFKRKILEKSQGSCYGCILGEVDIRDHSCQAALQVNIERYFNQIFNRYVRVNGDGLIKKLKEALCIELIAEHTDMRTARDSARRVCAVTNDSQACQVSDVSSSSQDRTL